MGYLPLQPALETSFLSLGESKYNTTRDSDRQSQWITLLKMGDWPGISNRITSTSGPLPPLSTNASPTPALRPRSSNGTMANLCSPSTMSGRSTVHRPNRKFTSTSMMDWLIKTEKENKEKNKYRQKRKDETGSHARQKNNNNIQTPTSTIVVVDLALVPCDVKAFWQ